MGKLYFRAMQKLNFPSYSFRLKSTENSRSIFSILRKKFLVLTPEEWVRQHCVHYLIKEKNYSQRLLAEEGKVMVNNLSQRFDIVGFYRDGSTQLIVECKAPEVKITQDTFDQIARYNMTLDATYLMVSNGLNHYFCQLDKVNKSYIFLKDLPLFSYTNE